MFLKIMFWFFIVVCVLHAIDCTKDHPRKRSTVNLGTDIIALLATIAIAVFMWFYAFGGWTVR